MAEHAKSKMEGYASDDAKAKKKREKPGIDVVLGSQWGDEGKGKLVDMLSQVRQRERVVFLGAFRYCRCLCCLVCYCSKVRIYRLYIG